MRPLGHNARNVKGAQAAYQKGVDAAKAGKPISACPYQQTTSLEHVDFGRKWRKKWMDGYQSVKREEPFPP
jgi:ribosome modulation factor